MKSHFQTQFERESMVSDYHRTAISFGIFLFGTAASFVNYFFFAGQGSLVFGKSSVILIIEFMMAMATFQGGCLLFLRKQMSNGRRALPMSAQFIVAAMEVTALTLVIRALVDELSLPNLVLSSPIIYLYFLFIVLSTLRLDARLTLFVALLSAFELLYLNLVAGKGMINNTALAFSVAKSFAMLLVGGGASFVAWQIRKAIRRSVTASDKANKLVGLFGQQVSREIVDEMLRHEGAINSRIMHVCIMFIDIRNFTSYVAGKSPEEIVTYQNEFFSTVIEVVARHQGIVNQFLGDGCMVTFGAPVALDNPSQSAVAAAIEIRAILEKRSLEGLIPHTRVGIGIHAGEVVTGNIGTDLRQQYSVTGTPVILAARLEQLNKEFNSQILVSADVLHQIEPSSIASQLLGPVLVKGWEHPVLVHKLA